jgi:hypothetical protein
MPKSRNRKDHKKKVQQRNAQNEQLGKVYQKLYNQKMVLASARGGSAGRIEDGLEQLAWGQTGEFRPQVCQCLRFTTERRLIAYRLPANGYLKGLST